MSKLFDAIDDTLKAFIEAQPVFYVATAPSGPEGHVNLSPKGGKGLFRVTGPHGFSYVDLIGSGIETVSHLGENGRIVAMFCSFSGPPKIVRLHGSGRVVQQGDTGFDERVAAFDVADEQRPAVRSVIEIDVTRVSDSCGFVVPRMAYEGERDQLYRWTDNRLRKQGPDALRSYAAAHNAESIDGLAGLDPPAAGPARETARRP